MRAHSSCILPAMLILSVQPAHAGSRLLATGGVTQLEGSAGGGLVPWALIAGLGSRDEIGGSAFCTRVQPQDFRLSSCGVAVGIHDRLELSFARQKFDLGSTVPGQSIEQNVFGAKLKVVGDAVYDQDTWKPQVAVGLQYKKNLDYDFVPHALGARRDDGVDLYVSATKVYLNGIAGRTVLLDTTLRATKANQLGILGFGGDRNDAYRLEPEFSAALFLSDHFVSGAEYRFKPDNLRVFREDDYWDAFLAWFPGKNFAVTVAYADLGNVADKSSQHGLYAALQASF